MFAEQPSVKLCCQLCCSVFKDPVITTCGVRWSHSMSLVWVSQEHRVACSHPTSPHPNVGLSGRAIQAGSGLGQEPREITRHCEKTGEDEIALSHVRWPQTHAPVNACALSEVIGGS